MKKKRALCIGINDYPGTNNDLSGCVNDAHDWGDLLVSQGYSVSLLLDKGATGAAMLAEMHTLIAQTGYGDRAVICYSGHGTNLKDNNGDEADGRDEALVPWDFQNGVILDDTLYELFKAKRVGARITMITDSCFSGTINRLFDVNVNPQKARPRYMPPSMIGDPEPMMLSREAPSRPSVVTFTGCAENEVSYDAWFGGQGTHVGRANGAMTRAAIDTFVPGMNNLGWSREITKAMTYDQHPQLLPSTKASVYWKALG